MRVLQKQIDAMYTKFPNVEHRVHAAISLLADVWMEAAAENRPADLGRLTVSALDEAIANNASAFKDWPPVLHSTDLASFTEKRVDLRWWLAYAASDGAYVGPSC
jgi:hypothetical protein